MKKITRRLTALQLTFIVEPALSRARELLDELDCSCVIVGRDGVVTSCHRRGVIDLFDLLMNNPGMLDGAVVADKVVGKGAAALMALGHVAAVYSRVMSREALSLLSREGVMATCDNEVEEIVNRAGTGRCPVETLCLPCSTAAECLPLIESFIRRQNL